MDASRFRQAFVSESLEHVDTLERVLLAMRAGEVELEEVHAAFRAVHSIKGSCSTFGLTHLCEFSHDLENTLDRMRSGEIAASAALAASLLDAVDCLRELLALGAEGRDEAPADCARVLTAVGAAERGRDAAPRPPEDASWELEVAPSEDALLMSEPLTVLKGLAALGQLGGVCHTDRLPALAELTTERCFLRWSLTLEGGDEARIREMLAWFEDDGQTSLRATKRQATPALAQPARANRPMAVRSGSSIRVDVEKIDRVMNMLGELVIGQAMLADLTDNFALGKVQALQAQVGRMQGDLRALQDAVMQVRMLPASVMLQRLPRVVDDLCRALGKEVDLVIEGERTEIDKRVLEELGDPVMHMVRNSLDHGIEAPEQRVRAGKPPRGRLRVSTFHRGAFVYLEIEDDGAGLNPRAILQIAKQKGLVPPDATPEMYDVCELIFAPGLSTAKEVTDVSGRGVGTDVVRRNIEALGGTVTASSREGKGCTFVIRLPLTLAIIDGQITRVGEEIYVLPLLSIVESFRRDDTRLRTLPGGQRAVRFRGRELQVIELAEVVGCERQTRASRSLLVVVDGGKGPFALAVDELLGQQQVVVKSLKENYGSVPGISAATILGSGRVAMILDIHEISSMVHSEGARRTFGSDPGATMRGLT